LRVTSRQAPSSVTDRNAPRQTTKSCSARLLGPIRRNVPVADLDDALARGQWQRGKDEQGQHFEDDGPDADRERHREPADNGEARILHEHPAPELQVEREPVEPAAAEPQAHARAGSFEPAQ